MDENKIEITTQKIKELYNKYKDNSFITQRIFNYINIHLPNTLFNEQRKYENKTYLNNYLMEEQQIFIQIFLSKNIYFYLPNNNFFYEYNGKDYFIVKEDEIIHKLLSTISRERTLLKWKHKTKSTIIKQIKDRNLFNSIPESHTIQDILNNLFPTFFVTKNLAKYFLTIIGDNILKKHNDLVFLVSPKIRNFLDELDIVSLNAIGCSNITCKFVTKYHENHLFTNCRIIQINENYSAEYWRELLKKIGLNLLCVACHYSNRYNNSDAFLDKIESDDGKNINILKNTTQDDLVRKFIYDYIDNTSQDFYMEWKNINFLWKQFLSNNNLPIVIYSNSLKNKLKEQFIYHEYTDSFIGITSKFLPVYKEFISFWNETIHIKYIGNEEFESEYFEDELEIDELSSLFKHWTKNKYFLSEENIIKALKHFLTIDIIDNKYILNISSKIWNKLEDLNNSIHFIREQIKNNNVQFQSQFMVSFDDLYNLYQKYCKLNSIKFIVSKRYFEKYLYYKFHEFIIYDKFIKTDVFFN
jgi:hypothetical protein